MVEQQILDTFIYETLAGSFTAIDPTEHDAIIVVYETKSDNCMMFWAVYRDWETDRKSVV